MTERVVTACRLCAVGCGTIVELDGQRVVAVAGDPDDPWSAGYTCAKGRAAPEFHHHPDRFDTPLVRRDGILVRTTWDDALDDAAARLRAVVAEHGPDAVADYTGTGGPLDPTGYAMAEALMRNLGSRQRYSALSIDCPSKFLVPQLMAGVQLQFQPDLARTDLLLQIGVNPVVSHGHGVMVANPLGHLRSLRARGARHVVVDPRLTETAHHADLHLALRPGTDPFLMAHVVREVLAGRGRREAEQLGADATSIERLAQAVAPFDLRTTSTVTGLAETELAALDALVAGAGRLSVETGTGVTMSRRANLTEWLVWALLALTGSLDRRGGVTFNPGALRRFEDGVPQGRGDLTPGPASRPDLRRLVNGEVPCAALADEIRSGQVRALLVRVGNPALAIAGQPALREALALLDVLVVVDARPSETTELATHVLPMADHFERGDVLFGYLQADPFLRWAPAVVPPVGQRRPQWWILSELAARLGLPRFGSARRDAALAGRPVDDAAVAESILTAARRPWAEVRDAPYGIRDTTVAPGWLVPGRLPQPLDLAPTELLTQLAETPHLRPANGLVLVNRRIPQQYNTLHRELEGRGRPAAPTLLMHPDDASARGLASGDEAEVGTAHGSCVAAVEVTGGIRAGVVSLPHGFASANVNRLTSPADADPLSGMTVLSGLPVEVSARRPAVTPS